MGNQPGGEAQPGASQDSAVGSEVLTAFQKKQLRSTWALLNKSAGPGGLGAVVFRKVSRQNLCLSAHLCCYQTDVISVSRKQARVAASFC